MICTKDVADILAKGYSGGIVISSEPKKTFFEIHNKIGNQNLRHDKTHIDPTANIHDSALIAEKGVYIGKNVNIYPNVVIKEDVYIGEDSIIREGSVIGAPAFYYYGE